MKGNNTIDELKKVMKHEAVDCIEVVCKLLFNHSHIHWFVCEIVHVNFLTFTFISAGLSINILFCRVTRGRNHRGPGQWQDVETLLLAALVVATLAWRGGEQEVVELPAVGILPLSRTL